MDRAPTHSGTEERVTRIEERLEHGNRSHADFRDRLTALEKRGEERTRAVLGWVLGFLIALLGWAYAVTSKPSEEKVLQMIGSQSPYLRDQDRILRVVDRYDRDGDATRTALEAIRLQLADQGNKLDVLVRAISQPTRRRRQP